MPIRDSIVKLIQKKDPNINHIDLSNCGLTDDDINILEELLENNSYITSLNISQNQISAVGAKGLATCQLKKLDTSDNYINDEGFEYLVKCPSLIWLDVSRNGVSKNIASKWYKEKCANFKYLYTGFNLNDQGEVVPLSEFELTLNRTTQAYSYSLTELASVSAQPLLNASQTKLSSSTLTSSQDPSIPELGENILLENIKKLTLLKKLLEKINDPMELKDYPLKLELPTVKLKSLTDINVIQYLKLLEELSQFVTEKKLENLEYFSLSLQLPNIDLNKSTEVMAIKYFEKIGKIAAFGTLRAVNKPNNLRYFSLNLQLPGINLSNAFPQVVIKYFDMLEQLKLFGKFSVNPTFQNVAINHMIEMLCELRMIEKSQTNSLILDFTNLHIGVDDDKNYKISNRILELANAISASGGLLLIRDSEISQLMRIPNITFPKNIIAQSAFTHIPRLHK